LGETSFLSLPVNIKVQFDPMVRQNNKMLRFHSNEEPLVQTDTKQEKSEKFRVKNLSEFSSVSFIPKSSDLSFMRRPIFLFAASFDTCFRGKENHNRRCFIVHTKRILTTRISGAKQTSSRQCRLLTT